MRVLQVCNKPPFPAVDGGCIAMNNLTEGLLQLGHRVKVIAVNPPRHFVEASYLSKEYVEKVNPELVFIDTSVRIVPAFLNLFSSSSYNVNRFYSREFEERLAAILREETFDIVQLESIFVGTYLETIRKYSTARVILRAHNNEHEIWERLAKEEKRPLRKQYLRYLAGKLKKYELSLLNQVDGIAAISERDRQKFAEAGCKKPMEVITFGLVPENQEPVLPAKPGTLFHLGSMDWQANVQGINWFVKEVWPGIHKKFPELELHLAGRKMPASLKALHGKNKLVIDGEVPDGKKYMQEYGVLVVPLFSGSGIRVKIIEALAMGKLVIATPVALEGIDAEHKKQVLVASTAAGFEACVETCFHDPGTAAAMRKEALALAHSKYNNNSITLKLVEFYKSLLQK